MPLPATDDERITYFAETDARGRKVKFGIKSKDRSRHMYIIGKTGMGKSTLLENLAVQDIQMGEGLTFIDPHGSTAEKLLDYVPEHRIEDVIYFAPFDLEYPISFNVMERVDPDKRHLVVNGLMSTFEKLWVDQWSARMAYILQNTLLALLEYPDATLLGVNRMYTDKEFRKQVVDNVKDPTVKSFWTEEYAKYTDRFAAEATPAIQNKIGQFASSALVRNIIGQPRSSFNLRDILDKRKIFIVNLSKGKVGEGNANLLGSMIITKLYLAALSRADSSFQSLRNLAQHHLYVDEFQSFANRSFADILSEARKYKLSLTIAHQYIEQMEEEVSAAVFGNVGTTISFRVGAFDAEVLEKEFAPTFTAEDMVNLGFAQIYLKLMIDGVSSQPFSATTLPPIEEPIISNRDRIIASSRKTYAAPRGMIEDEIRKWHEPFFTPSPLKGSGNREELSARVGVAASQSDNRDRRDGQSARSGDRGSVRKGSYGGERRTDAGENSHDRRPPAPAISSSASSVEEQSKRLRDTIQDIVARSKQKEREAREHAHSSERTAAVPRLPNAVSLQTKDMPRKDRGMTDHDTLELKHALQRAEAASADVSNTKDPKTPPHYSEIPEERLRALLSIPDDEHIDRT